MGHCGPVVAATAATRTEYPLSSSNVGGEGKDLQDAPWRGAPGGPLDYEGLRRRSPALPQLRGS